MGSYIFDFITNVWEDFQFNCIESNIVSKSGISEIYPMVGKTLLKMELIILFRSSNTDCHRFSLTCFGIGVFFWFVYLHLCLLLAW